MKLILLLIVASLINVSLIEGAKVLDRKALERLVRERIAKKNAEEALAKAVDIEVDNVVEEVEKAAQGKISATETATKSTNVEPNSDTIAIDYSEGKADKTKDVPMGKIRGMANADDVMAEVLDVPDNVELGLTSTKTSSAIDQMYWCRDGVVLMKTTRGQVYRSTDNGLNWIDLTSTLKLLKKGSIAVEAIEVNPVNSEQVVLIGKGSFGFISNDAADTFTVYDQMAVSKIQFHPAEKSWLLALVLTDSCASTSDRKTGSCYQQLMHSQDSGSSWSKIADYVSSADWQRVNLQDPSAKETIFTCVHRIKNGDQSFTSDSGIDLYASSDYFATPPTLVLVNAESFVQPNSRVIYAAVVVPGQNPKHLINLYVSAPKSGELPQFTRVNLPTLGQRSFTIVDASEESVFIHINHEDANDPSGSIYMSDSTGMQFSLSLPNNRRSSEGVADFQRVVGLEGIFLANYLHHEDSTGAVVNHWQRAGLKMDRSSASASVRTAITFDKGAVWSYLTPPKYDAMGNEISCEQEEDCFLHLHGISDKYGAMYSSGTAVGLIMATGSIGDQLGDIGTATYLSRDAGLTWQQVAIGSHIYQFGNYGALIVMAPDTALTDSVLYSWNQALTWYRVKISDVPIQISKIVVDPNGGTQNFLIHCSDSLGKGLLVHLDFSGLHEQVCEEKDFEEWTPVDDRGESSCIMGHKISYMRRKRESQCYNPMQQQIGQLQGDCPCTDRDFECDVGFVRNNDICEPVDDLVQTIENRCDSKGVHLVTKGYRRIPGNTCLNGEQWDQQIIPCSFFPKKSGHALLFTLLIVAIALATVMALSKSNLSTIWWCVYFRNKFGNIIYLSSNKKTIQDEEFEEFGFGTIPAHHMDDDFDQDLHDVDDLQYSHPIPPLPGLVQRQATTIPRIPGPKSDHEGTEA